MENYENVKIHIEFDGKLVKSWKILGLIRSDYHRWCLVPWMHNLMLVGVQDDVYNSKFRCKSKCFVFKYEYAYCIYVILKSMPKTECAKNSTWEFHVVHHCLSTAIYVPFMYEY